MRGLSGLRSGISVPEVPCPGNGPAGAFFITSVGGLFRLYRARRSSASTDQQPIGFALIDAELLQGDLHGRVMVRRCDRAKVVPLGSQSDHPPLALDLTLTLSHGANIGHWLGFANRPASPSDSPS
jgi:hypothetical protein